MQILPDTFIDRAEDTLGSRMDALPSSGSFAREFQDSFRKVAEDAENRNSAANPSDENNPDAYFNAMMANAPYNPAPEVFSPFAPQKVRFTTAEVDALIEGMGKDKVSPKVLTAIKEAGKMPGGATTEQLLRAATEALTGKQAKLSREDEAQLLSLSQKSAREQGKELQNLFTGGAPKSALESFLAGLDGDASVTVTREEMTSLIKALGLSGDTGKNLLKAFGDKPSITTTGKGMAALLDQARKELDTTDAAMEKLVASMEQRLKPVLRDAEDRQKMEQMAAMREDRSVAQARTLIQDTATQAAPGREEASAQDKQTRTVSRRDEEPRQTPTTEASASEKAVLREKTEGSKGATNIGAENSSKVNSNSKTEGTEQTETGQNAWAARAASSAKEGKDRDNERESADDRRSGRDAFGRDKAESFAPASTSSATAAARQTPVYASVMQGVGNVAPVVQPETTVTAAPLPTTLSSRTLDQIEQAVLTASKNGTQRLEVELTPNDLGTMTVVLTSRHGEVSAVIKPDRAETAALITQQAEQIRQELEHQGFKVEKVDVQTQLSDQHGQSWQNSDQHNSSRDQAARAEEMERFRRLGRMSGESASVLAHDMQISARTATVAARGLHLIA